MPAKLTAFRLTPLTASAEVGSVLSFTATGRYVNGEEKPNGALRWSIDSGAGSGSIFATTGQLTVRDAPGEMVIRATHTASGMYALARVTALAAAEPEEPDEPPEEPDPPPEPPPVVTPLRRVGLFAYALPTEQIGALWTGAMEGMGRGILAACDRAGALGGIVIAAQGGYSQYFSKNAQGKLVYDPDKMTAKIESHKAYERELKARYDKGWLFGVQAADDFSGERWPPDGLSIQELSRILRLWKSLYPWLPVGLRARPRQFVGEVPAPLDFYICQYRYWGGLGTPTQFRDAEEALADARGSEVIWSMNFLNGGGMQNGNKQPMTAAQVKTAGLIFAAATKRNLGLGGWMWDKNYMEKPGMAETFRALKAAMG